MILHLSGTYKILENKVAVSEVDPISYTPYPDINPNRYRSKSVIQPKSNFNKGFKRGMYAKRGLNNPMQLEKKVESFKDSKYPTFKNDLANIKTVNPIPEIEKNIAPFIIEKDQERAKIISSFMSPANINILYDKETNALSDLVDDNKSSNVSRTEEEGNKDDVKEIKNHDENTKANTLQNRKRDLSNDRSVIIIDVLKSSEEKEKEKVNADTANQSQGNKRKAKDRAHSKKKNHNKRIKIDEFEKEQNNDDLPKSNKGNFILSWATSFIDLE